MNGVVVACAVAAAGGGGAALRHLCDLAATRAWGSGQVRGVLLVNVVGCLAIGLLAGFVDDPVWARVASVGLLGGFTTFSTSVLQSLELLVGPAEGATTSPDGGVPSTSRALAHLVGTFLLGICAAALGLALSGS